jgi:hypothetical protein
MRAAIDTKSPRQRFDQAPRVARIRKKPAPVTTLGDDAETVKLFYGLSERDYRARLHRDFCRFCRLHDGWVITPPNEGRARVQITEGSALLEKLEAFPRYPVARLPGISERLQGGIMIRVAEVLVTLWR